MAHAKGPEGMRAHRGLPDVDTAPFMFPAHLSLPLASSPSHVCISGSGQQCRPRLAYDWCPPPICHVPEIYIAAL